MKHLLAAVLFLAAAMSANAQSLGPERVQNGGFDTASGWSLGNGWQITPGPTAETGLAFHNEGATSPIFRPVTLTAGATYRVSYTVTNTVTSSDPRHWVRIRGDSAVSTPITFGPGVFTSDIVAPSAAVLNHVAGVVAISGCACVIDNFSIRELLP